MKVYYTDPDNGHSTGSYTVIEDMGDMYLLTNGITELEAFKHECKLITQ